MNAKIENPEPEYIHEDDNSTPWIKSKTAKLIGIITGGVLALGVSFGAGVVVGHETNEDLGKVAGFDRDGDHKFPNGQHPPRPGDRDGDGEHGQFDPNQVPSPMPTTQNG
ncbi:MAG: hypothetical protein RL101_417 [Actinomycetota bacterium]|jgi:hypothetical protein